MYPHILKPKENLIYHLVLVKAFHNFAISLYIQIVCHQFHCTWHFAELETLNSWCRTHDISRKLTPRLVCTRMYYKASWPCELEEDALSIAVTLVSALLLCLRVF